MEERLSSQKEQFLLKAAFENIDDGILLYDSRGDLILGNSRGQALAASCHERVKERIAALLGPEEIVGRHFECDQQDRNGRMLRYYIKPLTVLEEKYFMLVIEDITDLKIAEDTIAQLAHYDGETGLPNYVLFRDRLNMAIFRGRRNASLSMIGALEVVVDSSSQANYESLIVDMAQDMARSIRRSDTLSRFSRREFLMLAEDLKRPEDAEKALKKVAESFDEWKKSVTKCPFELRYGYSLMPVDGVDPEVLVSKAFGSITAKYGGGSL